MTQNTLPWIWLWFLILLFPDLNGFLWIFYNLFHYVLCFMFLAQCWVWHLGRRKRNACFLFPSHKWRTRIWWRVCCDLRKKTGMLKSLSRNENHAKLPRKSTGLSFTTTLLKYSQIKLYVSISMMLTQLWDFFITRNVVTTVKSMVYPSLANFHLSMFLCSCVEET